MLDLIQTRSVGWVPVTDPLPERRAVRRILLRFPVVRHGCLPPGVIRQDTLLRKPCAQVFPASVQFRCELATRQDGLGWSHRGVIECRLVSPVGTQPLENDLFNGYTITIQLGLPPRLRPQIPT